MITIEQLAIIIRDNIHPGREGPLGDLYLDCAKAVIAALEAHKELKYDEEGFRAITAAMARFIPVQTISYAVEVGPPSLTPSRESPQITVLIDKPKFGL